MTQTAVGSGFVANGDISIQSGENITLEDAELSAGDTLALAAGGNDAVAVTQNAQGNYVNADGEVVGNITLGTQELHNSEWSESSSGFRGVLKDVVKSFAIVAASVGVEGEIKVGESDAVRRDTIPHEVTTVQANNLDIDAQNDVTLIGTDVYVANNATINANNVTVDAAQEKIAVSESHTDVTISSAGASFSEDTGELTLLSLTETDQTEQTTTATTWKGSNLDAGNLTINAEENVAIIASDITVENNASIEGENILVGGREDTYDTTYDSTTKTETYTVGVKNAYVDVAYAVKALDEAKDAVSDAEDAYDEAKAKVAAGTLPKSDLEFYEINIAAAQANVANASLAVASAGATAAASTATYGFTATAGASTQTDKTSTTISQGTWNGSSISVGGNTNLTSENNLTVEGSSVDTGGELNLDAQNISVIAGTNTYTENTESSSAGASATVSTGGNFGGSVNASESQSTQHVNSSLSGGSIVSNSDSLTIAGGNLNGGEIDITTDTLAVTSLQDTSNSSNESQGGNVGFGDGSVSSVGINASQGESSSAWVSQQSGITDGTVNITAKDTSITGATIAAVDENGNTTDNLTLITDTLTVANLEDSDTSKQMGIDLSTGSGSTTIGGNFSGHETEQTTYATIGLGDVTVGGESIEDQAEFADLNRDVATSQEITKDMERGGLDASVTVDHRVLTEEGRQDIANDFVDTYEHGEDIGRTVATLAESDDLNILNLGETLHNNAMGTQLKNYLIRNPENAELLAGLTSEDPEVKAQAYKDLGRLAQDKFGLELSDIDLYNGDETTSASLANTDVVDVKGGVVVDSNNEEYGTIKLDVAGESEIGIIDTLGHEVLETQDLQGQSSGLGLIANSEDTQEALGDAFGAQFADRVNQAVGGGLSSTSNDFANTYAVYEGTQEANKVGNAEVDHRQIYASEVEAIKSVSQQYAEERGITQNSAEKELGDTLRYYIDADFQSKAKAAGFVPDDSALAYLADSLEGEDYIANDIPAIDPSYSQEEIVEALKNYGETHSIAFEDRTIGGEALITPIDLLTENEAVVREFYDQTYPINASAEDEALQALGREAGILQEVKQTAENVKDAVVTLATTNPLETGAAISEGIQQEAYDLLSDPAQYVADKVSPTTDNLIEANLDARAGDFYEAGVNQGQAIVTGSLVAAETATALTGVSKVATSVVKVGEVDNTTTSNSTGNNGSYEAEGDFDGNNPSDSIYEEASGQAKLDVLVSQLPETEDISGEFTLDNSLSDQEFYNRLLQSENIDISKPENKGRKGAITELIRDVMSNITDDVDITK
ncbi:hemagglutinin repeat-containing protein [Marinomonas sp. 2405UD66-6]|uniref:hemagglutinin repeat-containing protein n=1 Tax=Marinomonas sp. 2405UD66-6 TaxID=3391834 RepID=UPI0039C96EFD